MASLPYILDNLTDDTRHAAGLETLVANHAGDPLAVATGYVNLEGLHVLASIADGRPTRLMLGAQPDPGLGTPPPARDLFEAQLQALRLNRDYSRFPPSRFAKRLAAVGEWLERPEVEVRRYTRQFLHGKAYLLGTQEIPRAAVIGSANLTGAGLHRNLELGLTAYGAAGADDAIAWFDSLWKDAAPFGAELAALLFPAPGAIDPHDVYLRALLELYQPSTEDPDRATKPTGLELANFQRDGYERARAIARARGGVVYADGVGTGKTEVGLAFVEERIKEDGVFALIVCPAQLKRRWEDRVLETKLSAQVISFNELAADEQLHPENPNSRRVLRAGRDYYRLVVVDEAHALRNEDTTWYRAMERLLGGTEKQVVLLTATPINNGLWDLYNLIMLFARHDRGLASAQIDSIRELFLAAGANERDPENLTPEVLYPIADAVSVRRDRAFIETQYPGASFPDGTPVKFPTPQLETVRYDLDAAHPGLVETIVDAIDSLSMARYRPSAYELAGEETSVEAQLGGLLRSGLLKRFESCWAACLETVTKMLAAHDAFLVAWEQGHVLAGELLREAAHAEGDESGLAGWVEELLEGGAESRPAAEFREEYGEVVAADRELLKGIEAELATLAPDGDPKLTALRATLETSPAKKVAVFATYAATVRYIDEHLPEVIGGRERVVVIGTETTPDERMGALGRFAPDTVVEPGYQPKDGEADLLLATDVLSEGQNLQQAQAVISYDMPWNPQRVVQRNGRVIRLKSEHDDVLLTTMLPEHGELEKILGLEARIRGKIKAAGLYGMESEVIGDLDAEKEQLLAGEMAAELHNFAERLTEGDAELLEESEQTSGAFVGEELRRMVDRALGEGELTRIAGLPWGIGACFRQTPGGRSVGAPGIFFATRTPPMADAQEGYRYWRYVELAEGELESLDLEILRRIDPHGGEPVAVEEAGVEIENAWAVAVADIVEAHNERANLRTEEASIGPRQRWALAILRDPHVALPGLERGEQAIAALSVERSSAVRRALGEVEESLAATEISRDDAAARIIGVVEDFGLRRVERLPPVEKIGAEDLGVVCWMMVLPAG